MRLFVGLGNPGPKYARHRHNIGFMALDAIAGLHRLPPWRTKFSGQFTDGTIGGARVGLLKPETFMNRSGHAVQQAISFFKLSTTDIYVFHDELDLAPGKVRVKRGGGHAGHNGLRSIQSQIGGPEFFRVRLGIGHPGDKARVHGHVLGDFAKAEEPWLVTLIAAIAQEAPLLAAGEAEKYMSRLALVAPPPEPASRPGPAGPAAPSGEPPQP